MGVLLFPDFEKFLFHSAVRQMASSFEKSKLSTAYIETYFSSLTFWEARKEEEVKRLLFSGLLGITVMFTVEKEPFMSWTATVVWIWSWSCEISVPPFVDAAN